MDDGGSRINTTVPGKYLLNFENTKYSSRLQEGIHTVHTVVVFLLFTFVW